MVLGVSGTKVSDVYKKNKINFADSIIVFIFGVTKQGNIMKSKLLKVQIGGNIIECQQETTLTVNTGFEKQEEPVYEMNLKESFEYLGISEHFKRAWNSSSTGELFFLQDYIIIANFMKQTGYKDVPKFTKWFNDTVDYAYKHWERPISIYQHIMNPENFK